ncbi:MAG: ribosome assembly RNA-binding protein YhbY [Gammaproteobacteria bacterium]|nr:ribosome assembly RNA-binding protein YhbY [Gammaproteobacteria bacterium]MCH9763428.1 ribosome assembly RNA-binding protein YhbY [Gammaproteobacteria bacterium]
MDTSTKNEFKAQAHHLKPVIIVGSQGVTNPVIRETDNALNTHELIKVKVNAEDKAGRNAITMALCDALKAEFIQLIGSIAIIYRKKKETQAKKVKSNKKNPRRRNKHEAS